MFVRFSIFVGLGSVVTTIIYLTPIPEQTFLSCDRPCHHLDWPMICRVKLTLEVFQSMSRSCGDCPGNETSCASTHCVSADGHVRGILSANRQLPGPSIQVCENDILVVDVINRLPGKAATIHWRGQSQVETPFMDGTPLVTQCPIPSYTTFQYKFRASGAGTHLWHAYAGADLTNGLFGSLIVRQADFREPHRSLYDLDDPNHVILVSHWYHSMSNEISTGGNRPIASALLINGKGRLENGPEMPLATFNVTTGRRYRIRLANAGGAGSCPITLSIQEHPVLLIALDGQPIDPKVVTSITLGKGERADVVLKANKRISAYWLNVETAKGCGRTIVKGAGVIRYKGSPISVPPEVGNAEIEDKGEKTTATNVYEKCGDGGNFCMVLRGLRKISDDLTKERMDVTLYFPINRAISKENYRESGVYSVGNRSFTYPSSPLLTQRQDIDERVICSSTENETPEQTNGQSQKCKLGETSTTCECVHVRKIKLGSTVEIVLFDQGGSDDLVYHLHGYSFHVIAVRELGHSISLKDLQTLNEQGILFSRNFESAPLKDTIVLPKFGAVALRFKANNPGYWILRDEHAADWTRGLDVILQVGEPVDMIPPPQDFPKCGSFVGPDYFLI